MTNGAMGLSYFRTLISLGRTYCSFSLSSYLHQLIVARGPLTVAHFMRETLTNPLGGYYIHREALGRQGDFTTSPEISQLFGEMLGVWCLHAWTEIGGSAKPLHVVELGPGRGTLISDVLRTLNQFGDASKDVEVSLVELSPRMRELQTELLVPGCHYSSSSVPRQAMSHYGAHVSWYDTIYDVPRHKAGFTVFIANEFFDALPVHQFVKRDGHWREILVDIDKKSSDSSMDFRLVVSPGVTPSLAYMTGQKVPSCLDCYEVCPTAGAIVQHIAARLNESNGVALIVDYGSSSPRGLTLRGFRGHQLCDVLGDPGSVDLTADVDFAALQRAVEKLGICFGPITQLSFLHQMGIQVRLRSLLGSVSVEQRRQLQSAYEMLTDSDKMGERFKFFVVLPSHGSCPYPFHT